MAGSHFDPDMKRQFRTSGVASPSGLFRTGAQGRCREESRHGTQECVRHNQGNGG
jgi:hypothetical protein